MVLQGFDLDSSLFTFPMTSIHAEARDNRHCELESAHGAGAPKRIGALKYLGVSGFEPQPPEWRASALSIVQCPSELQIVNTVNNYPNANYSLLEVKVETGHPHNSGALGMVGINRLKQISV